MSGLCLNCGVVLGPIFVSLALIIGGISSKIYGWSDLKNRTIMVPLIGIGILAASFVWMFIQIFQNEEIKYLRLFFPSLIGLAIISAGVYRMRNDRNFTGADYVYAGIALGFGSLLWIFWIFQAFS